LEIEASGKNNKKKIKGVTDKTKKSKKALNKNKFKDKYGNVLSDDDNE
jgi:hypothetical protein